MATKRKTKTVVVTYDVEFIARNGEWLAYSLGHKTLEDAQTESRFLLGRARIVRVERTVVAEVKP